ncbi:DNA primase [Coriobacterium glomerans PW2]|uniref:DNA primase n=1 Tax=Coriobacterium glomerans (strain ATCC 49209 / DSM 20642 / JCM 10262 / PW2) TaxID=700015 RepID=F2N9P3_CORGP|nr:DNA primase [Coriobacterium glomerans]AEB07146.1 DNA primase [Coriobacterium glomerans PW2]
MITDEDKDRVRAATDLVQLVQETVEVRQRGQEFWCCCPFHGEKTPSFHIIPSTQVWHCFGCGLGGDCFAYIMHRENLSFPESIRFLAERAGIELEERGERSSSGTKRSRIMDVCEATASFYHTLLMRGKDGRARDYFRSRGIGREVCQRYRLGFAPGHGALVAHLGGAGYTPHEMVDANVALARDGSGLIDRFFDRVIFPIFDEQGRCIAFGGRIMGEGQPKYLNTAETSIFHKKRNLYGFNWAKEHVVAKAEVIVVEGYTDAIACYEAGIRNVVATLGTALTEHHVKTLTRFAKRVIYLFDGDAAGQAAAERALRFIERDSIDLRCAILPDNLDPMEFVTERGGEALRERLDRSEELLAFVFRKLEEKSNLGTPAGRVKALEDGCRLIFPLRESYMVDAYYMRIADLVGLDIAAVRNSAARVFQQIQHEKQVAQRRDGQRVHMLSPSTRKRSDVDRAARTTRIEPDFAERELADSLEAHGASPSAMASDRGVGERPTCLSDLERRALVGERELISLLTLYPDMFRPFAERITQIEWVDSRHEAIAWAILATPSGSEPSVVMAAARAVCPQADQVAAGGTISSTSVHPTETNIAFLLDALELYTVRRRLRATQAQLRQDRCSQADERRELMIRASQDTERLRELARAVEGVADQLDAPSSDEGA